MRYVLLLLVAGCATIQPHQFIGPNGRTAYSMSCSGMGKTLDACYRKAGELCSGQYVVVGLAAGTDGVGSGGAVVISTEYHLAIECK